MTHLMAAYQQILVNGQRPDWLSLWPITLIAVVLCIVGARLFSKHAGEMVDEL
jgi:lipopolysaccharide transport system permease protein